jgi:microcystin-dependent protein
MTSPFLGEIRCFSFNITPQGWAQCNGQLLSISTNTALFALLGVNFGGDGVRTFGLPNLQGRVPGHFSVNYALGESTGEVNHTLLQTEMPAHTHTVQSVIVEPGGEPERVALANAAAYIGPSNPDGIYSANTSNAVALSGQIVGINGGSQPHNNQQPYLVLNFCIALTGIFPPRS